MTHVADLVERAGLSQPVIRGDHSADVVDIVFDSRAAHPGALFCCLRGEHADGHLHAADAVAAGATALLVDHPLGLDVTQVVVTDTRHEMGLLAAAVFDFPARKMTMVGVTGTNGKTTTTALLRAILERSGRRTGMIGTLTGVHTTPEAPDLQRQLAAFAGGGHDAVVMEVSSHALALDRIVGSHFDRAVFTNLGRDHLDLHGTVERYFAAKASLFRPELSDAGVVNADDPHGRLLVDLASIPMETFSAADAEDVEVTPARVSFAWRGVRLDLAFGGAFNVLNALAAAVTCVSLGVAPADIAAGVRAAPPVPGRFEPVPGARPFTVVVDYAHKPDALAAALNAARRASSSGRVLVVFGAGGDRDQGKRPLMGAAAAGNADVVVVTSDNPRSEDPAAIIAAIVEGIPTDRHGAVIVEVDRRQAIGRALDAARPGDVVLIAGKGAERTQVSGDEVREFDDRVVARELMEEMA